MTSASTRQKPPRTPAPVSGAGAPNATGEPADDGSTAAAEVSTASAAEGQLQELRRSWPAVLNRVKDYRKVTWAQLFEKSDVLGVDDKQLHIGLRDIGSHRAFSQGGHDEIVRQALIDVVGIDLTVVAVLDPTASAPAAAAAPSVTSEAASPPPAGAAQARAAAAAVDKPVVGKDRSAKADEDDVHADDPDADDDGLGGAELIAQQLGGTVIGEIEHT